MKKYLPGVMFLCSVMALCAQSRDDVTVYVAPVIGGIPEQQMFFAENFKMELMGANYAVVENQADSDYTMNLSITQDVEASYEDEYGQMTAEQIINVLTVSLMSTEEARELLQFSWAFETLEEMYEWNLHLIYQAMANVPFTKVTGVVDTNHWRNKWVYLRGSFDYPITFYAVNTEKNKSIFAQDNGQATDHARLAHEIRPFPGVTLGLEFQFLNWMSVEGNFQVSFGDPFGATFIPAIQVELKFPLKPSRHFMIEPYGVVSFPSTTESTTRQFPTYGLGGGMQLGVKGGEMGAFFVDVNYIHFMGDVVTANNYDSSRPYPQNLYWHRFSVGLGVGYKIGFVNRNKDDPGQVVTVAE
ncbi:MAG: hypothetical protein LBF95_08205 [Treponema sp.]|jgi:hypothetical protein|nr:hypothetical protein [Treponema sp.]